MTNETTILLVINPKAGTIDKEQLLSKVKKVTSEFGMSYQTFETTGKNDDEKLQAFLDESPVKRIVVAGGDGTINMVASVILNTDVSLGILACGSANGLVKNLNIPEGLEAQIRQAISKETLDMDVLFVNDRLCLHIAGLGLNAELIRNYDDSNLSGKVGYFIHTVPTLIKADFPYKFEIEVNGKSKFSEGILLAFANAAQFGTGANINPGAKLNDGKFEVVLFKKFDLFKIWKTFTNKPELENDIAELTSVERVRVKCAKPMALQIDGEFMGEITEVNVHVVHKALKLAVKSNSL